MAPTRRNVNTVGNADTAHVNPPPQHAAAGRITQRNHKSPTPVADIDDDVELFMDENGCKFSSSVSCETKEITWELKNFKALSQMKDSFKNVKVMFEAGRSIGMPSKWCYFIRRDEDDIGLYLKLAEYTGKEKEVFARYDTIIKKVVGAAAGTDFISLSTEVVDMKNVADWGWTSLSTIPKLCSSSSSVLLDDKLTIQLKFTIYSRITAYTNDSDNSKYAMKKLQVSNYADVGTQLLTMLQSGAHADVTLKTNDGILFKAHKVVLAGRSTVFNAMFATEMTEAQTGVVNIQDIGSKAFKCVLKFIYGGKLDPEWHTNYEEVIYAADKYNIGLLKEFCDHSLAVACTPDNALQILKVARLYNLPIANKKITDFIKTNLDGVLEHF